MKNSNKSGRQLACTTKITALSLAMVALAMVVALPLVPSSAVVPEGAPGGPNGLIAYVCETEGGLTTDICTLDPTTGTVVNLTNDSASDAFPDWSPDGTQIVFDSFRSTNQPTLHVMNADGTGVTRISSTPCCDRDFQPAWSPDGTRIVFVSTRDEDGEYELYVMGAEGEIVGPPAVRLTNDPAPEFGQGKNDWQATWSPDSQRIAFVSNRDPDDADVCDIYVMDVIDADGDGFGDNLTRLTFDNDFECEIKSPAWSPTSEQIAFTSTRSGDYEIWVMNSDGTNLVNVTNFPGQDFDAGWSPDGTQITFVSGRDGDYELYSTPAPPTSAQPSQRAAATEPPPVTQLTHNTTNDREPDWGTASATTRALTVAKAGSGRGKVKSAPLGINCGRDCTETYAQGLKVKLTAHPRDGSIFAGWSGVQRCDGSTDPVCVVKMKDARTVTAMFAPAP